MQQPVKSGCVVVVGLLGSRDWAHSTHGRKIEAAVGMRRKGCPVSIEPAPRNLLKAIFAGYKAGELQVRHNTKYDGHFQL